MNNCYICDSLTMFVIFLLSQALVIHCYFLNETVFKSVFNDKKNIRNQRCLDSFNNLGKSIGNFYDEEFGGHNKYSNISDCSRIASSNVEIYARNILDKLLIHDDVPELHWDEYKSMYDKVYRSWTHELAALKTWQENLSRVAQHNQEYLAGRQSYSLHLNLFGDWPTTTYMNRLLRLIKTVPLFDPAHDPDRTAYISKLHHRVPRKVDWRAKGFNPRREEQWQCGACYAFAVAHALQGQLYRTHRLWGELSPQQIVDCSIGDGNLGCNGGSLQGALRYAARAGMIMESEYPYTGKRGFCHYNSFLVSVRPRRWATLPSGDEEAIERALALIGPIAVAVNAAPFTFQLYRSGIYDDPFCTPWELNHAMLLVGYTQDYWLLLNWWGRQWGEDGYMRIRRGFNRCGVANMATYVEL